MKLMKKIARQIVKQGKKLNARPSIMRAYKPKKIGMKERSKLEDKGKLVCKV